MDEKCKTNVLKIEKMFAKQNICSKKLLTNKCMFDIMTIKKQMFVSYVRMERRITDFFNINDTKEKTVRCYVMYGAMHHRNISKRKELLLRRKFFACVGFILNRFCHEDCYSRKKYESDEDDNQCTD